MILNSQKNKISLIVTNICDLIRILLGTFLLFIVLVWAAQIFNLASYIPFYESLSDFLTKFNSFFVTMDVREETNNSVMFLSLNILILLLLFSFVNDLMKDMMKLYERSREEAIEEDNIRINEQIKKNYEFHLQHTMHFVLYLRLKIKEDSFKNTAFYDPEYSDKLRNDLVRMLDEIRFMIRESIKCERKDMGDDVAYFVQTPEQLNRILVFIRSVCNIEKYMKSGLSYYVAVVAHTDAEKPEDHVEEALRLINLKCRNKILCHQVVSECLNTVVDNKFLGMAYGNYEDIPNSLYELIEKSSY